MYVDLREFAESVLLRSPSVALVTWQTPVASESFSRRLNKALKTADGNAVLTKVDASTFDSAAFDEAVRRTLAKRDAARRCVLLSGMEPLASSAGRILNGYRERFSEFRALIVLLRANGKRDFMLECPDLMDWVGTRVARAEDLLPPLAKRDIRTALRTLEKKRGMTSADFLEKWRAGELPTSDELSYWAELIAIRDSLIKSAHD